MYICFQKRGRVGGWRILFSGKLSFMAMKVKFKQILILYPALISSIYKDPILIGEWLSTSREIPKNNHFHAFLKKFFLFNILFMPASSFLFPVIIAMKSTEMKRMHMVSSTLPCIGFKIKTVKVLKNILLK